MSNWKNGIPDYSLTNYFVYFEDLRTELNNSITNGRKKALVSAATEDFNKGQELLHNLLTDGEELKNIGDLISAIAENERNKELKVIQDYYKKMNTLLPNSNELPDGLDENTLKNDPEKYYTTLINYINLAKRNSENYKIELKRIMRNIDSATKKDNRSEYSYDDYQYNLASDITSFFKGLIGTKRARKDTTSSYTMRLQEAAIQVLEHFHIAQKLEKGEEFIALAIAVLTDLEKHLQQVYDEQYAPESTRENPIKLADVLNNDVISKVVEQYIKDAEKGIGTEVQHSLVDIQSREAITVIRNGINTFGITKLKEGSSELEKQLDEIEKTQSALKHSAKDKREAIQKIRNIVQGNEQLEYTVPRIKIDKINYQGAHGTIHEYVSSIFSSLENGGRSLKIKNPVATDIMSWQISYHLEEPDLKAIDELIDNIIETLNSSFKPSFEARQSYKKNRQQLNRQLNIMIQNFTHQLDDKIRQLDENAQIFIFHESLKLSSAIETGKSSNFSGRSLNILSALDILDDIDGISGIALPNRDLLATLALNLSPQALAHSAKEPLERYFSLFAGMLMFDDVRNMALEAVKSLQYTNSNHIHLYKLNRIYMPASLILSNLAINTQKCAEMIMNNSTARAMISTGAATKTINRWLDNRAWNVERGYVVSDWQEVASRVASFTKVKIVFMAAFLQWIKKLSE